MTVTRMPVAAAMPIVAVRALSQLAAMVTTVRKQSSVTMVSEMLVVAVMQPAVLRGRVLLVAMVLHARNLKLVTMAF